MAPCESPRCREGFAITLAGLQGLGTNRSAATFVTWVMEANTLTAARDDTTDALDEATTRLSDLVIERQRAKPGSRKDQALLGEEERLRVRVATLSRLRAALVGR